MRYEDKSWYIYRISPARDMLNQLLAAMAVDFLSEKGKEMKKLSGLSLSATVMETGAGTGILTFFRRATTVQTGPLNFIKMTEMYRKRLGIDTSEAKKMADMTCGYAYAFQELGVIRFKHKDYTEEELVEDLKTELFAYAYDKIWEELSEGDRELARLLTDEGEYKKRISLPEWKSPATIPYIEIGCNAKV